MAEGHPRGLVVAGAASHSGKTLVAMGLIAAMKPRGLAVAAAKCGPDYIDPRYLAAAAGGPAVNLDAWAMRPARLAALAASQADGAHLLIIEGVMGLFDGAPRGEGSTAKLAAALGLPVVLVVDGQATAQSAAAVAEGFARLAEGFTVAGAIVTRVASDRHAALVREGFARASVPLLGLVRRDERLAVPSRHLGLVQAEEQAGLARLVARAGEAAAAGIELDRLVEAAAPLAPPPATPGAGLAPLGRHIAVARDVAFAFAYPHLLADWRRAGAELTFFSPLLNEAPDAAADAIYLPGGYPELHAGRLAAADRFRGGLKAAAERGALVYGECGGYMALGEGLIDADGACHSMTGLLPLVTSFAQRRLALGYRRLEPLAGGPWAGPLAAHEFHYATIVEEGSGEPLFSARAADGAALGVIGRRHGRVMGSFAHVIDPV
jgi:cobyrinic acid a,c-diamide synthase